MEFFVILALFVLLVLFAVGLARLIAKHVGKKGYFWINLVLIIIVLIKVPFTIDIYINNYATREWFRESTNDGDCSVIAEEIGRTFWGRANYVEIYVNSRSSRLHNRFRTQINNGGGELTEDNYNISYTDEYISIELIGYHEDGEDRQVYRFYFDDHDNPSS